ncbi:MAG: TfoX/Sxy family protein [Thermodesulfobacteriota bacterium]
MSVSDDYIDFVSDLLSPLGEITVKRMFGGAGIYLDGLFFAIIENDTLRFKVDATNRADFEALGMGPFKPYKDKKEIMQYYEVPIDVLEDNAALEEWALKALEVARTAKTKKKKSKKKK